MNKIALRALFNLAFALTLQPAFAQASAPSAQSSMHFAQSLIHSAPSFRRPNEAGKPIDIDAMKKWTDFNSAANISPNGEFASFVIDNETPGYKTLFLSATDGHWKRKIIAKDLGYEGGQFTSDSRFCVFSEGDSLGIASLGAAGISYIPHATNASLIKGDRPYLVYDIKTVSRQSIVYDLKSNKTLLQINCENRVVSPDGSFLVCRTDTIGPDGKSSIVEWYDLSDLSHQRIWTGAPVSGFKFDETGNKLAFVVESKQGSGGTAAEAAPTSGQAANCIAVYTKGTESAQVICSSASISDNAFFTAISDFNQEGDRLFVSVTSLLPKLTPLPTNAKVDVWNFNDAVPQWKQLQSPQDRHSAVFGVDLANHTLYKLNDDWEYNTGNFSNGSFSDKFMVFSGYTAAGLYGSDEWNSALRQNITLVNTRDGSRRTIDSNLRFYAIRDQFKLSPDGKYILYYDFKSRCYCSYEVSTGIRRILTAGVKTSWTYVHFDIPELDDHFLRGIAAWMATSDDVLIYDRYDIWRVSLDESHGPICITNGFGKKNKTRFVLFGDAERTPIKDVDLYVSAFNEENKKNGFFFAATNKQQDPLLLTMGDFVYYAPDIVHSWGNAVPVKAANADKWLVCRQSATSSRNYFVTQDFKTFRPITDIHPESNYNWLTTELIHWKLPDGRISKGILYKPQNFDPAKRYPVIFNYYELLSDNLNVFIKPELSVGDINIPYYVSNGYLVFTPDIRGSRKGAGWDAVSTMVSAGNYLAKLPFVDAKRMGIQGGSMGGYKTQFIVTQTHLFAAANAMCGISNLSSMALHPGFNSDNEDVLQYGQFYLGYSIIDRPDLYVKSSPIFFIKNVQTPLLLTHNPKDDHVPDLESIYTFNALRRAGKPTWLLQYDGYGHGVGFGGDASDVIAQTDFTIRQKQFFDYYLKGGRAPEWMVKGVSARFKGVDNGLELMPEGVRVPESKLVSSGGTEGYGGDQ